MTEAPLLMHTLLRLWLPSRSPTVTQLTYGLLRVEGAYSRVGQFSLLPEEDFGFYMPAIRAVELVDSKIAACCVRLDNGQP